MRIKALFLLTSTLVLCTGLVVGRLTARLRAVASTEPVTQPSHDELNLSEDQKQKMHAIWMESRPMLDKLGDARRAMDHDREQQVQAMLTPAQLQEYNRLHDEYRAKRQEIDRQREQLQRDANDRIRALLDDTQKKKWDATVARHEHRGPTTTRPSSRPGSRPAEGWDH